MGAIECSPPNASSFCAGVVLQLLESGVPRVPGYTGRASNVIGFEASGFFCCAAFLSIDGIAPKAINPVVSQVDQFVHPPLSPSGLLLSRCCVSVTAPRPQFLDRLLLLEVVQFNIKVKNFFFVYNCFSRIRGNFYVNLN